MRHILRCVIAGSGILGLAACGFIGWGYLQGYRLYAVQTDSMKPLLNVGDGILVRQTQTRTPALHDIVTYRSSVDPSVLVTHRLVAQKGSRFIVKGDALTTPDPAVAPYQLVGTVTAKLPLFGIVLNWLRSPIAVGTMVYVPILVIMAFEVLAATRSLKRPTYRLRTRH